MSAHDPHEVEIAQLEEKIFQLSLPRSASIHGEITKNFRREEFKCPCCHLAEPHPELIMRLQEQRTAIGRPIMIESGSRCKVHNKEVGGVFQSQHLPMTGGYSKGVDVSLSSARAMTRLIFNWLKYENGVVIFYPDKYICHLDNRNDMMKGWGVIAGQKCTLKEAMHYHKTVIAPNDFTVRGSK